MNVSHGDRMKNVAKHGRVCGCASVVIFMLAACGGGSSGSQSSSESTTKPAQVTPPSTAQCAPDLHCAP
jgi:hypothetical protein